MATAESVKNKIQGLISQANEATGKEDADLTAAVGSLISGFGQGSGENLLEYACSIQSAFSGNEFDNVDFVVSFGAKCTATLDVQALYCTFQDAVGLRSVTVNWEGIDNTTEISFANVFRCRSREETLEMIDLTGIQNSLRVTTMNRTFEYRRALREIWGEFDLTNCAVVGSIAAQCIALETIRFKPGTIMKSISFPDSKKLTDATIQNIIDGLADLTGSTAQTLTFHATVGAKLTDDQKATVSAKNWTLAY